MISKRCKNACFKIDEILFSAKNSQTFNSYQIFAILHLRLYFEEYIYITFNGQVKYQVYLFGTRSI